MHDLYITPLRYVEPKKAKAGSSYTNIMLALTGTVDNLVDEIVARIDHTFSPEGNSFERQPLCLTVYDREEDSYSWAFSTGVYLSEDETNELADRLSKAGWPGVFVGKAIVAQRQPTGLYSTPGHNIITTVVLSTCTIELGKSYMIGKFSEDGFFEENISQPIPTLEPGMVLARGQTIPMDTRPLSPYCSSQRFYRTQE